MISRVEVGVCDLFPHSNCCSFNSQLVTLNAQFSKTPQIGPFLPKNVTIMLCLD